MKKYNALYAVFLSGLMLFSAVSAHAVPNLLIMGEDAADDTIPRDSRVFKRVFDAMNDEMVSYGFGVYDETAISMENFEQGLVKRKDSELIDIARSMRRPPIDVVVIFELFASAKELPHTTKVRARISGRLLNVHSGRRLGSFELESPSPWNAPKKCNRECIVKTVGDHARVLGRDLAAVLSEKLQWLVDGRDSAALDHDDGHMLREYDLVFDGFTPDDMNAIEEYLVIFSGYKSHRPVTSSIRHAEIWYESRIGTARLNRNLDRMMGELGIKASIQFDGNKVIARKISRKGEHAHPSRDGW